MATGNARDLLTVNKVADVHSETEVLSYFSDFQNNKGNWETMIGTQQGGTGTISFIPFNTHFPSVGHIVGEARLQLPNDSTDGNQAGFGSEAQANSLLLGKLLPGLGAMTMEYKIVAFVADNNCHRIAAGWGRHHAHASTDPENHQDITITWQKFYGSTWSMCVANTNDNVGLPENRIYVDTGISASDWHVLRIDVSEAWDKIEFFCDGERTGCFLRSQYPNAFPPDPNDPNFVNFTAPYANFICSIRQANAIGGTNGPADVRLDYASAKYFIRKKS